MPRRVATVALAAALVAGLTLLTAPAAGATGPGAGGGKVTLLTARLKGANEVPGPGDPDGRGRAFVRLGGGKACFVLEWSGIGAPMASHIHQGGAGVAGPVVVPFFDVPELAGAPTAALPSTIGAAAGCVGAQDPALLRDIRRHPAAYYANIHTLEFVPGAIRGQLRRVA